MYTISRAQSTITGYRNTDHMKEKTKVKLKYWIKGPVIPPDK